MAAISGQNVFMQMKFEGGVHRVQRVPKTEKSGRMHTSTVTVAILPQPSEVLYLSTSVLCCFISWLLFYHKSTVYVLRSFLAASTKNA